MYSNSVGPRAGEFRVDDEDELGHPEDDDADDLDET
jgi:hypothetical protein